MHSLLFYSHGVDNLDYLFRNLSSLADRCSKSRQKKPAREIFSDNKAIRYKNYSSNKYSDIEDIS